MEEGGQDVTLSVAFPRPPPFHGNFTRENIEHLRKIRQNLELDSPNDITQDDASELESRLRQQDLPQQLRFLIPPEPPGPGTYRSFQEYRNIHNPIPSLPEGIEKLTRPTDPAKQLHQIAKALLLTFLELVGTLSKNPEFAGPKIDELRTLFFNAHELMNGYRPHQARESLIEMMRRHVEKKRREIEGVKQMSESVDAQIAELSNLKFGEEQSLVQDVQKEHDGNLRRQREREKDRRVWQALHSLQTP